MTSPPSKEQRGSAAMPFAMTALLLTVVPWVDMFLGGNLGTVFNDGLWFWIGAAPLGIAAIVIEAMRTGRPAAMVLGGLAALVAIGSIGMSFVAGLAMGAL